MVVGVTSRTDLPVPRPLSGTNISVHLSTPDYSADLGPIDAGGYSFYFPGPDEKPTTNATGFVRFIEPGKILESPYDIYNSIGGDFVATANFS